MSRRSDPILSPTIIHASVLVLLLMVSNFGQGRPELADKERIEAKRLWDQMVNVRGGREKLRSIKNMVLTKGSTARKIQVGVYDFPDKYWEWSKEVSLKDSVWVLMANLESGRYFVGSQDGLLRYDKNLDEPARANFRETYQMESCRFLLETKWLSPEPIGVTTATIEKQRFDVIETHYSNLLIYPDRREDFYVDPESMTVRAIAHYAKGKIVRYYVFDGYRTVNGVHVPTGVSVTYDLRTLKNLSFTPLEFQFNVGINKTLFEEPPTVEAGSTAWKPVS